MYSLKRFFSFAMLLLAIIVLLLIWPTLVADNSPGNLNIQDSSKAEDSSQKEEDLPSPYLLYSEKETFPGDFISLLIVNTPANAEIKVESDFLETSPPIFSHKLGKIALIPLSYRTKSGDHLIKTIVSHQGNILLNQEDIIKLKPKVFETQYLQVSGSLAAQRSPELSQKDSLYVDEAKSHFTAEPLWADAFLQPIEGRISTQFGQIRFINGTESGRHAGIDIAAPRGTPVKASNKGIIRLAKTLNVTGNTVIIDHGLNVYTSYAHLDRLYLGSGREVEKGEIIGTVGSTGFSTGPHLHWTISINSVFVNPWLLMEKDPLLWLDLFI